MPLRATDPALDSVRNASGLAASGELPTPDDATAERVPTADLSFGPPLAETGNSGVSG